MKAFALFITVFTFYNLTSFAQNGLEFDGSDDYVQTTFSGPTGKAPRTIELWIKAYFNSKQVVLVDYGDMSNGQRFTFNMINGRLRMEVGGNGVTGSQLIADTTWHHVAVTYNDNASPNFRTYVDGVIQDSFNLTVTVNTSNSNDVMFGRRNDGINYYAGYMDEIRMWDYARTSKQIKDNYQSEFCDQQAGLILYHKLNHGIAGGNNTKVKTSIDYSKNHEDGTLNNFDLRGTTSNWLLGKTLSTGSKTGSFSDYGCDTYTSPSGKYTWTKSGTYTDTFESYMGCDSIATINLTVTPFPNKTMNVKACDIYRTPGGKYVVTSGTYKEKIKVANGCDTLLTLNIIIGPLVTYDSMKVAACKSYTSPSGKYTWDSTGRYTDTLPTWIGCDSVLVIDLSINKNSGTAQYSSCLPITSPSGNQVWSQSGTYLDTVQNKAGCDSVITAQVSILQATSSQLDLFGCTQIKSPSGKYTYTQEGTYQDTIANKSGCDSIMTLNVKLGQEFQSLSVTTCDSSLSPSGLVYYTSTGVYYDTLKTGLGCDSIVESNVTIHQSQMITMEERHCQTYTSPSGKYTWTKSGNYTDSFRTSNGCDSVIEIALTIDELPTTSFTKVEDTTAHTVTLTADANAGTYQWLTCLNGNKTEIDQATNRIFVADSSMSVALAVEQATCADTSDCVEFEIINSVLLPNIQVAIYPNPNNGQFQIQTSTTTLQRIEVYNITQQMVYSANVNTHHAQVSSDLAQGVYILMIYSDQGKALTKLIIE